MGGGGVALALGFVGLALGPDMPGGKSNHYGANIMSSNSIVIIYIYI